MSERKELGYQQQIAIINEGLKSPFWLKLLVPYLEQEIADYSKLLRTCALEDVQGLRAKIDNIESLLNMPKTALEVVQGEQLLEEQAAAAAKTEGDST